MAVKIIFTVIVIILSVDGILTYLDPTSLYISFLYRTVVYYMQPTFKCILYTSYTSSLTSSICIISGPPCPHHNKSDHTSSGEPMALTASSATVGCPQCVAALSLNDGVGPVRGAANDESEEGAVEETDREGEQSGGKEKDKKGVDGGCSKRCRKLWYEIRTKLWGIVESKYFNRGIMIAILINTISMGIEHHEQVQLQLFYVTSNISYI